MQQNKKTYLDRIYRIYMIFFLSFLMKLRKGSSCEDMLLADEDILMVSAKDTAMSILRLTGYFCLSSGKAEDLFPVEPVNPV